MAGALKQDFVEAVRLTPDGIKEFLETPIPEAPTVSPADDTANEALAAFLLNLFRPFAGLTPVELLLRIGQHNSVLESAMIAGLEYIEGADSESNGLTILEPQDGQTYDAGEMRFTASTSNAVCIGMSMTLDGGDPIKMVSNGEQWGQYVDVGAGEHTVEMNASFENGGNANANASFTVAEAGQEPPPETPPEPPGGKDTEALDRARERAYTAYRQFIRDLRNDPDINPFESLAELLRYFNAFKSAVLAFIAICPDDAFTTPKKSDIQRYLSEMDPEQLPSGNVLVTKSSAIIDIINSLYVYLVG